MSLQYLLPTPTLHAILKSSYLKFHLKVDWRRGLLNCPSRSRDLSQKIRVCLPLCSSVSMQRDTTSFKVRQERTQPEHTAKCDRTEHNWNIMQSATGLDTNGTYCKVRQDWTQLEHTAKCDRTGHNRNILQ
jgi:hypothetical protein